MNKIAVDVITCRVVFILLQIFNNQFVHLPDSCVIKPPRERILTESIVPENIEIYNEAMELEMN